MSRVLLIVAILGLLAVIALLLTGCVRRLEDEPAVDILWAKRGQTVGDLVWLYCEHGSRRERAIMATAFERAAYPAVLAITCVPFFPPPGQRFQPVPPETPKPR